MKLVFDIDGTLTDFNTLLKKYAYEYFEKKYNMVVVNPNALEVEDIFDMDNFFKNKYNCDINTAKSYTKKALNLFWTSPFFIRFAVLDKFRPGVKEFINGLVEKGCSVEIHSSRCHTKEATIGRKFIEKLTMLQFKKNGIFLPKEAFNFYKTDEEKIKGMIEAKPDNVFEDKKEIIEILDSCGIKSICIIGQHNKDLNNVEKWEDFTKGNTML